MVCLPIRARTHRRSLPMMLPVVMACAAILVAAAHVHAEPLFQESSSFATGQYPFAVAAADLDGDGRLDLVTANRGAGTLSVLRGLGGGQFAPHVDLPAGTGPSAVAIADVNGDLRLDLLSANSAAGSVSVLLGTVGGAFLPAQEFRAGTGANRVVVADLDGDGRPDLATLNGGANTLSVLHGQGDGTFAAPQPYATGLSPSALAAGDLDGDQHTDLVVTNQFGAPLSVFRSLAGGTLAPRRDIPFLALNPSAVVLADMNGDAILDAVVASTGFDVVSILHGIGDGSFGAIHELGIGLGPYAVVATDLDADGRPDLGVANIFSSTLAVQRQLEPDQYAEDGFLVGGEFPADIIAVDVNQDGRPDLVSANNLSNTVSVFLSRTTAVSVEFRLAHDRIDVHSGDDRVTAFIEPPAPFGVADLEVATIRINDVVAVAPTRGAALEDRDHDDIPEMRVRFERQALLATLPASGEAVVRVTGRVGGRDFVGADTVQVRRSHEGEGPRHDHDSHAGALALRGGVPDLRVVAARAHDRVVLDVAVPAGTRARLEMLDVAGRRVAMRTIESSMGTAQRLEWPEAGARASGLYFVRLVTDREISVARRVLLTN